MERSLQLTNYITGKDSYCYFLLGLKDQASGAYHVMLYTGGKNPMDNVIARIVDVYAMSGKNNLNSGTVLSLGKIYPQPGKVIPYGTQIIPKIADSIWINAFFSNQWKEVYGGTQTGESFREMARFCFRRSTPISRRSGFDFIYLAAHNH